MENKDEKYYKRDPLTSINSPDNANMTSSLMRSIKSIHLPICLWTSIGGIFQYLNTAECYAASGDGFYLRGAFQELMLMCDA